MDEFTQNTPQRRIALLIDGDNARPTLIAQYIAEAGKYGAVTLRRIYGDWTTNNMKGWKEGLNNHAVQPIQQFRYTIGKNATDSSLIIDAMDILHSRLVDGFCIVSSDSDYTRLSTRIREAGIFVMGIGENKTPKPFVNACNLFIFTENLLPKPAPAKVSLTSKGRSKKVVEPPKPDPLPILRQAFELAASEDGWAHLSVVGNQIHQLDPSFDPRTFGFKQLSQLIKAQKTHFELKYEKESGPSALYVRMKD